MLTLSRLHHKRKLGVDGVGIFLALLDGHCVGLAAAAIRLVDGLVVVVVGLLQTETAKSSVVYWGFRRSILERGRARWLRQSTPAADLSKP